MKITKELLIEVVKEEVKKTLSQEQISDPSKRALRKRGAQYATNRNFAPERFGPGAADVDGNDEEDIQNIPGNIRRLVARIVGQVEERISLEMNAENREIYKEINLIKRRLTQLKEAVLEIQRQL